MRIAVDAMGGDHAPDDIVRGALLYREVVGTADLVLVGDEPRLRGLVGEKTSGIDIVHAGGVVGMDEHPVLRAAADLSFFGNSEGRDVLRGTTDIALTDGFNGNVLAKGLEGAFDVLASGIRTDIFGGPLGKIAGAFAFAGIRKFRGRFDYDPYVSAPLLGIAGVSVVTHGRARANMMRWAIAVGERAVDTRLVDAIGTLAAPAA